MMGKNKKEMLEKNIAIFEIVVFMISIIGFGFMASDYSFDSSIFNINLNFFDLIPSVSAQTLGGGFDFNSVLEGLGSGQSGCCFDKDQGLCSPNSNKQSCENQTNGKFLSDALCNSNECSMGCCILGNEAQFVTSQRCIKLSSTYGVPSKYHPEITDPVACINMANSQTYGACVYGGDASIDEKASCKFTTKEDCNTNIGGIFKQDYLCSNSELNSICEKQKSTGCVEGRDEIYWYDSCGNRENIYDANKEKSWNNGKVLSKEQSCNSGSNNINSATCGNCGYDKGSICSKLRVGTDKKKKDGEYVCRNLNCKDGFKTRTNGESWCLYDGMVGNGRDVVGSRHFRELCVNGEIKTEPCADYRKEICVQEGGIGGSFQDMTGSIFGKLGISVPDLSSIPGLSGLGGLLGGGGGGLGAGLGGLTGFVVGEENVTNETNVNNETVNQEIEARNSLFGSGGGLLGGLTETKKALCRANMWEDCSGRNIMTCSKNPDCMSKIVYVDKDFYLLKCVPKYPPGIELSSSGGGLGGGLLGGGGGALSGLGGGGAFGDLGSSLGGLGGAGGGLGGLGGLGGGQQSICSAGTETCTVIYEKKCPGGWKCVKNCDCEKMKFTIQMNDYCTMLGDCGAKANIAGKVTDQGYSVSKKGGKAKKPPRITGISQIYSIFAKGGMLQGGISSGVSGGFYNSVPGLDMVSQFGISLFGGEGGLGGTTGANLETGGQFGNMFSGSNLGGTIGAGAIGGGAALGADLAISGAPLAGSLGGGLLSLGSFGIGFIAAIGIMYAMGCGKKEKSEITFTCKQWQPPASGNCDFCNGDSQKPCSKYRCSSLGRNCKLINENTGQDKCVSVDLTQGTPIITPFYEVLNESFKYQDVSQNGFKVRDANGECIAAFTPLVFGVKTNIPSYCKISEEEINSSENGENSFDDFGNDFLEGTIYTENHTTTTYLPSVESLIASETNSPSEFAQAAGNESVYNYLLNVVGDINLHVKCQSVAGQENEQDFRINFCVKPGPDLTPPIVVATAPPQNSYVRNNATNWGTVFFINEPSECRYSSSNIGYFNMNNTLDCEQDVSAGTLFGYPCNTTLQLNQQENKFYIACRDQPWLGNENSSRNVGNNYEYILKKTETGLSINNLLPSGNITKGNEPASVDLTLGTSGGIENGKSICQYSMNNQPYITFANTISNTHSQTFTSLVRGNYNFKVRCVDSAGNSVSENTNFTLQLDTKAPQVTRVYYSSGSLAFFTDEEAICSYQINSPACGFLIDSPNSTKIEDYSTTSHNLQWDEKTTYSVKCQDIWGNKPGGCSIIVKPETILNNK